uniref:Torsin-1A-interacting protein 1/2 AAA+ activator domain-containing protein n=1 Tax=Cynoglossus semilaevis TaxID=244447 RepID=A0A3P8UAJ5_CYNSE
MFCLMFYSTFILVSFFVTWSDDGKGEENDSSEQEEKESDKMSHKQRPKVQTIGPIAEEKTEFATTLAKFIKGKSNVVNYSLTIRLFVLFAGNSMYVMGLALVLVAVLLMTPQQPGPPPQLNSVDLLLGQMDKLKTRFPHQRSEFWTRSRIHLKRHLQTAQPTAPVNLILTAGVRAERTLHCLAQGLASAFSFAVNASVLNIDGASAASQDSDQVKLDIDNKLQGAFEGDKPVAVIHRFEELPPGSTLIFYRYCDHENAAFKQTVLIFTVLLEDDEIPGKVHLNSVEEMVDDHLKKKFLTSSLPVSFDRMDLDKYSGLWSRISHLILPVAAETRVEHQGC